MKRFRYLIFLSVIVSCFLFFGCNRRPDLQRVEGTVTIDGDPFPNATVVFMPKDGGQMGFATTNEKGYYVLSSLGGIPQKRDDDR